MSNPTISQIKVGDGVVYDLCDSKVRNDLYGGNININGALTLNTNSQNGQAKTWIFDNSTLKIPPKTGSSWVKTARGDSAIHVSKLNLNTDSYVSGLTIQTRSGGAWSIGNYDDDSLLFTYMNANNINNNTNTATRHIKFFTDGTTNLVNNNVVTNISNATKTASVSSDIITLNTSNTLFYYTWTSDGEKKEWFASAACAIWGKVCSLSINWKNKNAITVPAHGNISNVTIGNLPVGKRPAITTSAHSYGDSAGPAWYLIGSNGNIQLGACEGTGEARTISANTTFNLTATYVLA